MIKIPRNWIQDSTKYYAKVDTNDLMQRSNLLLVYVLSTGNNKLTLEHISIRDVDDYFITYGPVGLSGVYIFYI